MNEERKKREKQKIKGEMNWTTTIFTSSQRADKFVLCEFYKIYRDITYGRCLPTSHTIWERGRETILYPVDLLIDVDNHDNAEVDATAATISDEDDDEDDIVRSWGKRTRKRAPIYNGIYFSFSWNGFDRAVHTHTHTCHQRTLSSQYSIRKWRDNGNCFGNFYRFNLKVSIQQRC